MIIVISQISRKLIFFFALSLLIGACTPLGHKSTQVDPFADVRRGIMAIPNGKVFDVRFAITHAEKQQGLSGVKVQNFSKFQALFFYYPKSEMRQFWMPDTYFNLDIFFLDENLRVSSLERNIKQHPGTIEPPPIARTKMHKARYVLEMRSDSPLAREIKVGDQLNWKSKTPFPEIELKIRQKLYSLDGL